METNLAKFERLADLAHSLISSLYDHDPDNPSFEQLGIINGREVIDSYIEHNEMGIAVEHLLFIVHETEIAFPGKELDELYSLASELGVKNAYAQKNA